MFSAQLSEWQKRLQNSDQFKNMHTYVVNVRQQAIQNRAHIKKGLEILGIIIIFMLIFNKFPVNAPINSDEVNASINSDEVNEPINSDEVNEPINSYEYVSRFVIFMVALYVSWQLYDALQILWQYRKPTGSESHFLAMKHSPKAWFAIFFGVTAMLIWLTPQNDGSNNALWLTNLFIMVAWFLSALHFYPDLVGNSKNWFHNVRYPILLAVLYLVTLHGFMLMFDREWVGSLLVFFVATTFSALIRSKKLPDSHKMRAYDDLFVLIMLVMLFVIGSYQSNTSLSIAANVFNGQSLSVSDFMTENLPQSMKQFMGVVSTVFSGIITNWAMFEFLGYSVGLILLTLKFSDPRSTATDTEIPLGASLIFLFLMIIFMTATLMFSLVNTFTHLSSVTDNVFTIAAVHGVIVLAHGLALTIALAYLQKVCQLLASPLATAPTDSVAPFMMEQTQAIVAAQAGELVLIETREEEGFMPIVVQEGYEETDAKQADVFIEEAREEGAEEAEEEQFEVYEEPQEPQKMALNEDMVAEPMMEPKEESVTELARLFVGGGHGLKILQGPTDITSTS